METSGSLTVDESRSRDLNLRAKLYEGTVLILAGDS